MIIEGAMSVKAALEAKKRDVLSLMVDEMKRDRNLAYILHLAKEAGVPVQRMPRSQIDAIAKGKTHGGVLAEVSHRQWDCLESLDQPTFFLLVEGIVDPYNFGYICRSAYAAGVDAILMPTYHWKDLEAVITKASAGAFEHCAIVTYEDSKILLLSLKKQGFQVFAGYRKEALAYDEVSYPDKLVLCVGGEMRGLSNSVLEMVDQAIYLPYGRDFKNALNGSSATSIFCFEVLRQRRMQWKK